MTTDLKAPGAFEMTITAYRCRCGYEWASRKLGDTTRPRVCPKCKSANWDKTRKYERKPKA